MGIMTPRNVKSLEQHSTVRDPESSRKPELGQRTQEWKEEAARGLRPGGTSVPHPVFWAYSEPIPSRSRGKLRSREGRPVESLGGHSHAQSGAGSSQAEGKRGSSVPLATSPWVPRMFRATEGARTFAPSASVSANLACHPLPTAGAEPKPGSCILHPAPLRTAPSTPHSTPHRGENQESSARDPGQLTRRSPTPSGTPSGTAVWHRPPVGSGGTGLNLDGSSTAEQTLTSGEARGKLW